MKKANATGYFPYTPSLPLLYGLRESLAMLFEEGLENVLRAAPPAGRRDPRGRQGVGPRALRPAAQVVLGHGQRHHGARGHQRAPR